MGGVASLGWPLVVLDACILDSLFWFPWLPMPGLWAGFWFIFSFARGVGLGFFGWFASWTVGRVLVG